MKSFLIPKDFSLQNEEHVYMLQQALYAIDKANVMQSASNSRGISNPIEEPDPLTPPNGGIDQEIVDKSYGKSTQDLLDLFQETLSLRQNTNYVLPETVNSINNAAEKLYRVCGYITNDYKVPIEGVEVEVLLYHQLGNNQEVVISNPHVVSLQNGSFCAFINFSEEIKLNKKNRLPHPICVAVKFKQDSVVLYSERLLIHETETIINFSSPDFVCTGTSHYDSFLKILVQNKITDINGEANLAFFDNKMPNELFEIASQLNIDIEMILRVMLSRKNTKIEMPVALFGYLYQGHPSLLPTKIYKEAEADWEGYLNKLYDNAILGLSLESPENLEQILIDAKKLNYITITDNEISDAVSFFINYYENNILNEPLLDGDESLASIFAAIKIKLINNNIKKMIAKLFTDNLNDFDAFIKSLDSDSIRTVIDTDNIGLTDRLIYYFQISRIVRNLPEMIVQVAKQYPFNNSYHEVRKLARLTLNDWKEIIERLTNPIHSDFADTNEYAEYVFKNAQMFCPSLALVSKSANLQYKDEIEEFLLEKPEIELLTANIDDLTTAIGGNNSENVRNELKRMQNAYRIAPTPEAADVLLERNMTDVGQIYFIGKSQFAEDLKDKLSAEEIDSTFEMATARFANALVAFTNMHNTLYKGEPKTLPAGSNNIADKLRPDFPNIENLFGDTDFCVCDYDKSVYSAPAYLSDILAFIDNRKAKRGSSTKVKNWLDERRQDISQIYLNKQNATTVMPYIDLVNEVLEEEMLKRANGSFVRNIKTCQSTLSTEELCAAPEHILDDGGTTAYDIVCEKMYPMYAPFHLSKTQIRSYLNRMGIQRHELMKHFVKDGNANYKKEVAGEFFGLTPLELKVILGEVGNRNEAWRNTKDPDDPNKSAMTVKMFLEDSGLSVYQLLDMLRPGCWTDLDYDVIGAVNCIDKEKYILEKNTEGFDRAHRFIRILNKSTWCIAELSLLLKSNKIASFTNTTTDNLNKNTLYNLMLFKQQQDKYKLSCEELLACYDYINPNTLYKNGEARPALFKKLFLHNNIDASLRTKLENLSKSENNTTTFNEEEDRTLAGCLSISYADFLLLQDKWGNGDKNVAYLSYLYRNITFAQILGVSIENLILLYDLLNENMKISFAPDMLSNFFKNAEAILKSELSLEEYNYLLNYNYIPDAEETSEYSITSEDIHNCATALKEILNKKDELEQKSQETERSDVRENLQVRSTGTTNEIIVKLSEFFGIPYATTETYLSHIGVTSIYPSAPQKKLLDVFTAKENYIEDTITNELYYAFALLHKATLLLKKYSISSEEFKHLYAIQEKIGFNWYQFNIINTTNTQNLLTISHLINLDAWLKLNKKYYDKEQQMGLLSIINKVNSLNEFKKTLCQITNWEQKDIDSVLIHFSYNSLSKFYQLSTYTLIEQALKYKKNANTNMGSLLDWANLSNTVTNDEKRRSKETFDALKSKYDNDTFLKELEKLNKPIREAKCNALSSYLVTTELRKKVIKEEDRKWFEKTDLYGYFLLDTEMTALMKTSRIVQATNSVQLFVQRCIFNLEKEVVVDDEYDVEWKQWEWMQKYRLWEANRKVFLYPENWIEPELRDDKTPLFKELEDELNQNEITDEHVETCYANYLNKLDEISNLTVCATYHEAIAFPINVAEYSSTTSTEPPAARGGEDGSNGGKDSGENGNNTPLPPIRKVNTFHVIARSKTIPYIYYYRKFDGTSNSWTPWEKIDIDIQGDVVVPFVYNKRLHLFWIKTVKKSFADMPKIEDDNKEATNYSEIQLGWSVLRNKKWSPVKYSHKKHLNIGHGPETRYSMIAHQNLYSKDLNFRIFAFEDENSDKVSNMGEFIFNGDVYRSVSFINYYSKDNSEEIYKNFTHDMDFSAKPERETLTDDQKEHSTKRISLKEHCEMYNNKFYLLSKNNSETNIWLHDSFDDKRNIIATKNSTPHLITMVHNLASMDTMIEYSHLIFPFFYQDSERSFFVRPYSRFNSKQGYDAKFEFSPFYHPYTKLFMQELDHRGLAGLLNRKIQVNPDKYSSSNSNYSFKKEYKTADSDNVAFAGNGYEKEIVDFNYGGGYATYNWELFFHVPLYIASKLSQNQKFEEAMKWFHTIFNPTSITSEETPTKYWITKPFYEMSKDEVRAQGIRDILENIDSHVAKVNLWLNNPYNPHFVARTRPVAFQRAVVMKYIDNIINWADQLFRRDTMEENNQATLLYVLAYQILGKRPVINPKVVTETSVHPNYNDIKNGKNIFYLLNMYNDYIQYKYEDEPKPPIIPKPFIKDIELITISTSQTQTQQRGTLEQTPAVIKQPSVNELFALANSPGCQLTVQDKKIIVPVIISPTAKPLPRLDTVNFCIPFNQDLLRYWDTVEDRLFKLRNCMNIDGIIRELPLFEPPIDPAMLVKAAAAGISIGDALNSMGTLPYYRFRVILQKAIEFTNEVKQFGDKLLSALEKKDAEVLSSLRNIQEINMQQAALQVRKLQIEDALQNIKSINESINNTTWRQEYYAKKEFMNALEGDAEKLGKESMVLTDTSIGIHKIISALSLVPTFNIGLHGFGGSPALTASWGVQNIIGTLGSTATTLAVMSGKLDKNASQMLTKSSYQRRKEDWDFQAKTAQLEVNQLNEQLIATKIRLMIAEKELANAVMQIEQSLSIKEYYESKYTNETLYNWMSSQIVNIYFQAYQLAYDMAKNAEKCYMQELGLFVSPDIIKFGHWDSLNKGLLAGDRLIHQLHQLDAAYIENNKRTFEITKHISLAQMFPENLLELISEKITQLNIPEWIYDMDYPGHYMRRIKSVSVTIPNVAGPNTNVSFKLSLTSSKIRTKNTIGGGYNEPENFEPSSIKDSICTSSAQNDSGLFELNFGDERYLPFENAGAISDWTLEFTGHTQFDLSTVSDVILNISYTAEHSESLKADAETNLETILPKQGVVIFNPKQDCSDEWNNLSEENTNVNFEIKTENIPFYMRGYANQLKMGKVIFVFTSKKELTDLDIKLKDTNTVYGGNLLTATEKIEQYGDLSVYKTEFGFSPIPKAIGSYAFDFDFSETNGVSPSDIEECVVAITFTT